MRTSMKTIIATVALALSVTTVSLPASADVADDFSPVFRDALSPGNYDEGPQWIRDAFKPARFDIEDQQLREAINPASLYDDLSPELREALDPARFDIEDAELREALNPAGFFDDYGPHFRDALEPASYLDGYSDELKEALEAVVMEDVPSWAADAFAPGNNDERNGGLAI